MIKNKRQISIDIECDGPCPAIYSMISFGAVIVEAGLQRTFYGELRPISEIYNPDALAVSGFTREQTLAFPDPYETMLNFDIWIKENIEGRPILWTDNPMFDAGFINYYFHKYLNRNPFGWSASGIGQLYKGIRKDLYANFKHLRDTKHTHHPVDDAKGNAEALLKMYKMMETGNIY